MSNRFTIRYYCGPGESPRRSEQWRTLRQLDTLAFPGEDPAVYNEGWWWLARHRSTGLLVGFAGMEKSRGNRVFMCRAGVRAWARGNALQRRLLQAREAKARQLGMERAITYTTRWNIPSGNNLIRAGYSVYWPADDWGGSSAVYWYKEL